MMQCLGEMATWLPLPGAIPQYCARYVDPALGFAVGWVSTFSTSASQPWRRTATFCGALDKADGVQSKRC